MKTVELSEATASLAKYAKTVADEPVILVKDGKPFAALVPISNADRETASLSTNPRFLALIERSRAREKSEGSVSAAEMRRRFQRRAPKR